MVATIPSTTQVGKSKIFCRYGSQAQSEFLLQPVLHQVEAVLVDDGPGIADLHVDQLLVGDGLGAVIDEEDEGKRQQAQADEAKQEFDHEGAGGAEEASQKQV